MRRDVRILLSTVVLGALWAVSHRVPDALASMETFRVKDVTLTGLRYLDRGEVLELMDITAETSIWTDREQWLRPLREHDLVKDVRLHRRMPGTLEVRITERRPVALVPTPTLEPVDAEGVLLPIDPAEFRLDLPVVMSSEPVASGSRLTPAPTRALAAQVGRLAEGDTTFLQMVSEVSWGEDGSLVARWSEPRVEFLLPPDAAPTHVREGLTVLADAVGRSGGQEPDQIDLRYADQVVVRRTDHTQWRE